MGIDVGFSKTRQTTGIACLEGDHLSLGRAGTAWESRKATIPHGFQPSVIAIDGPLLPQGAPHDIRRHVESVSIRTPFHNRCRPGLSHHGVGLELRQASGDACTQFGRILAPPVLGNSGTVCRKGPIVEAFPNAFLGVLCRRSNCWRHRGSSEDGALTGFTRRWLRRVDWSRCCQKACIFQMWFGTGWAQKPTMNCVRL
jgi:hypothetical protein